MGVGLLVAGSSHLCGAAFVEQRGDRLGLLPAALRTRHIRSGLLGALLHLRNISLFASAFPFLLDFQAIAFCVIHYIHPCVRSFGYALCSAKAYCIVIFILMSLTDLVVQHTD